MNVKRYIVHFYYKIENNKSTDKFYRNYDLGYITNTNIPHMM